MPIPSARGNSYIFTVQCSFTKWVEAYALPNHRAKTCARTLVDDWVYRYSGPDDIHLHRNFESRLIVWWTMRHAGNNKFRTTAYTTLPYRERTSWECQQGYHETVNGENRKRVSGRLDQHLEPNLMAYRSSDYVSTGYTPFSLTGNPPHNLQEYWTCGSLETI